MGKLLWTLSAATLGFVAAVAATPDDDAARDAYQRGFAEGTKKQQTDAVRRGFGVWYPSDAVGSADAFRWSSQVPARGRGVRWASGQSASDESVRSARNDDDHSARQGREAG